MKIVNIEKLSKENNAIIQRWWMYVMSRQSIPPGFEETEDEDAPSRPLVSLIFLHYSIYISMLLYVPPPPSFESHQNHCDSSPSLIFSSEYF